jgi:hypothetical protein
MRAGLAVSTIALAWLSPALALACPVCFGANEANRQAFLGATIFMSLFPLAMIGGLIGFLVLRARAADGEDTLPTARDAAEPRPSIEIAPTDGGAP